MPSRTKKAAKHAPAHPKRYTWTTENEIAFLREIGLGKFGDPRSMPLRTKLDRKVLLRHYLEGMALRHTWGTMNHMRIRQAALDMLAKETTAHGA